MRLESTTSSSASSTFDKVLSKLETTIKRVRHDTDDKEHLQYERRDDETVSRGRRDAPSLEADESRYDVTDDVVANVADRTGYLRRLNVLANRVKQSKPNLRSGKSSGQVVVKPSPRLSVKKAASDVDNSIIWRAYATTKSFGSIVQGVVATQALIRKWLVVRRVDKMKKDVKLNASVKDTLSFALDKIHDDPEVNVAIKGEH